MKARPKPTKATMELRTTEILRIRLDGAEIWDVREYVREQEQTEGSPWKLAEGQKPLSDSQLWRYIARADKLAADTCRASRKKLLRRSLARRRNIYAKAMSAGDYRTALAAVRDEAELLGLYPPKKVAPTNPDGTQPYGQLTDAERAAALQNLYARVGAGGGGAAAGGDAAAGGPVLGGPDAHPEGGRHGA
jgi:hypothetical protein